MLSCVPHTKWERHRGAIEHDIRRYWATTGQLCDHIGEGVGDAVQIVLGRLRSQECLELPLQMHIVEDVGSRNRRGVWPLTLEVRTLQGVNDTVADGACGRLDLH